MINTDFSRKLNSYSSTWVVLVSGLTGERRTQAVENSSGGTCLLMFSFPSSSSPPLSCSVKSFETPHPEHDGRTVSQQAAAGLRDKPSADGDYGPSSQAHQSAWCNDGLREETGCLLQPLSRCVCLRMQPLLTCLQWFQTVTAGGKD